MPVTTVLFDLDGTLLPMDYDLFLKSYFSRLTKTMAPLGYVPDDLVKAVWKGTHAMVKNTGEKTNEEVFWDAFVAIYGEGCRAHIPQFDAFYRTEFRKIREVCGFNPAAAETVRFCRDAGLTVALATNPIFPMAATENRIRWTGMEVSDFAWVTTYENSRFCKPNPDYYRDVCRRIGKVPEECLMVGNDTGDDMPAAETGMRVFLLTDCLLNPGNGDITQYPNGDFAALRKFIEACL
ncbi:MAG: HAD family hydrolase [Clostridia bacterium]|nr:HAD family hydrolase [Clostridia bacterium]